MLVLFEKRRFVIAIGYLLGIFGQSFVSSLSCLDVFLTVRYKHCYWYKEQIHLLATERVVRYMLLHQYQYSKRKTYFDHLFKCFIIINANRSNINNTLFICFCFIGIDVNVRSTNYKPAFDPQILCCIFLI